MSYKIYTTEFDEIVRADELVSPETLSTLFKQYAPAANLDAAQPQALLKAKTNGEDICVTLLLDNSGSLRGGGAITMAKISQYLGNSFQSQQIPFEILGFTTVQWKGGQSRQKWLDEGRPSNPGRLNDLRHIIYKDVKDNWDDCKKNLALLTHKGALKENIDGEALQWAASRTLKMPHKRKIIIALTDGAPVDDSTLVSNNKDDFLKNHLREVVAEVSDSGIEVYGLGINYKSDEFYPSSTKTDNDDPPENAAMRLFNLINQKSRTPANWAKVIRSKNKTKIILN